MQLSAVMAAIPNPARITRRRTVTSEDVVDFIRGASRRSVSFELSDGESSNEGSCISSFWESSDEEDLTSLSGHSSLSDSELFSGDSSDEEGKKQGETDTESDNEIETGPHPAPLLDDDVYPPLKRPRMSGLEFCKSGANVSSDVHDEDDQAGGGDDDKNGTYRGGKAGRGGKGGAGGRGGYKSSRGGGQDRTGRSRGRGGRSGGRDKRSQCGADDSRPYLLPKNAVSILSKDTGFKEGNDFLPCRQPGPQIPDDVEVSALRLFELFFDDEVMERIIRCTLAYTESRKEHKKNRYTLFMRKELTKKECKSFLGSLILLGIHGVRNYRKAWSASKAQFLVRLQDLMSCQRFELIGTFLHIVTNEEEVASEGDPLKKIRPLPEYIKQRCSELYQPLQQISIDERMVKSKARCHLIQYMKDKPRASSTGCWRTPLATRLILICTRERRRTELTMVFLMMSL